MKNNMEKLKEFANECWESSRNGLYETAIALISQDCGDGVVAIGKAIRGLFLFQIDCFGIILLHF